MTMTVPSLAGSGTRAVTANANGLLAAANAPAASGLFSGQLNAPPVLSNWTQVNWGSGTSAANSGTSNVPSIYLADTYAGSSGQPVRALTIPRVGSVGSSYTLTAAFMPLYVPGDISTSLAPEVGIFVSNGTALIMLANGQFNADNVIGVKKFTNFNTGAGNILGEESSGFGLNGLMCYRIVSNLTTRSYQYSIDLVNWLTVATDTISGSILPNTETVMGFATLTQSATGAPVGISLLSWLQTSP
jgi:hypothetical protein